MELKKKNPRQAAGQVFPGREGYMRQEART